MPLPRDREAATDVGGNALVVSRDAENPRLAARFCEFMVSEPAMREYCTTAGTLPTRTSLAQGGGLQYQVRPEDFEVFVQQATTLPPDLVEATTLPSFTPINEVFTRELEALVVNGQDTATTLRNMAEGINRNLES